MNIIGTVKTVATFVVPMGVSAVVKNAVKSTTPEDLKTYQKVLVNVGSFVIGSMVGDQATRYVNTNIDFSVAQFNEAREQARAARANRDRSDIVVEPTE